MTRDELWDQMAVKIEQRNKVLVIKDYFDTESEKLKKEANRLNVEIENLNKLISQTK